MKKVIFFVIFFCLVSCISTTIFAQKLDSPSLIDQLDRFELTNRASFDAYGKLFHENRLKLSPKKKYQYMIRAAQFAKQLELDTTFVIINFNILDLINNQLIDLGEGEIINVEKSKALAKTIEKEVASLNIDEYSAAYFNLAGVPYQLEGNYVKTLEYYTKSIDFFEKSTNPGAASGIIENIIKMYSVNNDYDNWLKYAQKLLALNKYIKEPNELSRNTARALHFHAGYYRTLEKEDSVIYYVDKELEAVKKIEKFDALPSLAAFCDAHISKINLLLSQKEFSKAATLLATIDTLCREKYEPTYTLFLANYYVKTGDYEKVGEIFRDTSNLRFQSHGLGDVFRLKAAYHEGIGNYKEALRMQKEYLKVRTNAFKTKKEEHATFLNARLEASKQAEAIDTLKLKTETENLKTRILLIGLLLSLVLLFIGIYAFLKLKQKNKTIEKQAAALKKVDTLKSKLFTNISHELRTPLTLISGPIEEILKQNNLDSNNKKQLTLAKKSSQQLLSISNQIMDLTKSEMEVIQVNPARFYWYNFLDDVLPIFAALAHNQNLTLIHNQQKIENILLQSDPTKLKIVLSNLLQNAIKFSKNGGSILLDAKDKREHLEFSVKDTGIGISPSELPKVFNRYYQSANTTQATGGFGIGLAICQEYVKSLGGSIKIDSELGKGTIVTVSIPKIIGIADTAPFYSFDKVISPTINNGTTISEADSESAHLLIIEDNADLRAYLESILLEDYTLSFAVNGVEALKKLETITPSLILTDWMMPSMNGLELVEKVKTNPTLSKIPVLMLTARSLPTDQLKAFRKGVDDYLLKPFEPAFLKLRIEHLLDFSERRKEIHLSEASELVSAPSLAANGEKTMLNLKDESEQAWISDLENRIQSQIHQFDLTVNQVTAEIGISKTHFNRKVKTITGLTPMQFIDEIRFWEARRLLEEKEVSTVKSVAYTVGFKSVKNFSRNFKKRFGDYPSKYLQ